MEKLNIGIILGSTREGRVSPLVGNWVLEEAQKRGDANYTILDLVDYKLPLLGEKGDYSGVEKWTEDVTKQDGFVFVVQEYNRSISAALKNALDYLNEPWNNKAAGIVSYGSLGGTRATEHLKGILGELQIADVRQHTAMSTIKEIKDGVFTPEEHRVESLNIMLDQLNKWSTALKTIR